MTEDLAAFFTRIGFLPSVDYLVNDEGRAADEGLAAVFTRIRFLPSVDSPMLSQA